MNRSELEHVIRAACAAAEVTDVVIIGSQAILGSVPEYALPTEATRSLEADIAVDGAIAGREEMTLSDEAALADAIDGAIGEQSMFFFEFGIYAQGVETTTAQLTEGWRERLVPVICESVGLGPVVGWCLEIQDLWVSKAAARREKDIEFCVAVARVGLVTRSVCAERIKLLGEPYRSNAQAVFVRAFGGS